MFIPRREITPPPIRPQRERGGVDRNRPKLEARDIGEDEMDADTIAATGGAVTTRRQIREMDNREEFQLPSREGGAPRIALTREKTNITPEKPRAIKSELRPTTAHTAAKSEAKMIHQEKGMTITDEHVKLLREVLAAKEQVMNIKIGGFLGFFQKKISDYFPKEENFRNDLSDSYLKSLIKTGDPLKGLRPVGMTMEELGAKIKHPSKEQVWWEKYECVLKKYQHSLTEERPYQKK